MFSAELLKSLVYRRCAIILFEASAAKIWVPLKEKNQMKPAASARDDVLCK